MDAPSLEMLAARVDRLERQVRRWQGMGMLLGLAWAIAIVALFLRIGGKEIAAERFVVRD
ncbi:MAG: hypothetical protein IRY99_15425, partial [Isosphaeraceae bacterium]|nr:hypothetical protein [Isosphaeraceae bacterium]